MEVKDMVDLKTVKTNMNAKTKDEALKELANLLHENGYISEVDGFIKDTYVREAQGQTGIGNYIAIPHGKSPYVKNIGVAIGINNTEIPWESLDGNGVKGIILFAVGNDNEGATKHLKLLSLFARKLGNDEVVEELIQSESPEDVVRAFS
ncbi:PTS family porter component IIA [Enterococcus sp. 7E2_DIV0204]|uniref:PTS sugar transporter subunit IIA n=1 Tax=unclassified Enterococcus TaxID=2608891 RepID=UPI000A335B10|nr:MULTISPECIES: fructose PTS transporter subunit IIA [unclassified Enterococcus]OTN86511.1 PTS family porter component IIA [Enterococcus sp. 7E2_DIV0204]OTP47699.1 PTS family porter component IIA [Enterococcus sp. 7D2_DIV0200]